MNTNEPTISLINFDNILTKEQVDSIEKEYNATFGVDRRCLLHTLARSGRCLADSFAAIGDNGEALILLCNRIVTYKEHLEEGIALADEAISRILLVAKYIDSMDSTAAAE